jgi:hypothetical protein
MWNPANLGEREYVGLITALLVMWNTWRANRQTKVIKQIHVLTNSAMGMQLKVNVEFAERFAVQTHRIAEITQAEGDVAAAVAADRDVEIQKDIYQAYLLRLAKADPIASTP